MQDKRKTSAIIVAAGLGTRMKSDCPKQYIEVHGKPILYYTLRAFQDSCIDDFVIVVAKEYCSYVEKEIVERYGFSKVCKVVEGGKERYESVLRGLKELQGTDYVLVHDGARPYIRVELINKVIQAVMEYRAVVVGVRAKDTVKIVNEDGYVSSTPDRSMVWNIQTPQAFEYKLLKTAYDKVMQGSFTNITDDAMVVEYGMNQPIKVIEGSYQNIKITTQEDLIESAFLFD